MNLLSMLFLPVPCNFLPLRPKYVLSTLFSNTLSLYSSLNVTDKVSHTHTHTTEQEIYSSVCCNPYIFGKQTGRRETTSLYITNIILLYITNNCTFTKIIFLRAVIHSLISTAFYIQSHIQK